MRMKIRHILSLVSLILAISFAGTSLYGQTKEIESGKERIKALEADINYLDKQIQATQKQKKNTMDELVLVLFPQFPYLFSLAVYCL